MRDWRELWGEIWRKIKEGDEQGARELLDQFKKLPLYLVCGELKIPIKYLPFRIEKINGRLFLRLWGLLGGERGIFISGRIEKNVEFDWDHSCWSLPV